MRRKLHDWFGWHAWTPLPNASPAFQPVWCKCGDIAALWLGNPRTLE